MAGTNGTPKAKALGARLKEARKAAGYTVRGLADQLGLSHSAISRWETGARSPETEDVASVLAVTGASSADRSELLEMARGTNDPQWLSVQSGDRERQMAALLEFERDSSHITDVSPLLIPGLLQTADYARAIMIAGEVPPSEVETRVAVRVGRRETLTRRNPAQLLALVGEAAIRQQIGGRETVVDQLNHLLNVAEMPNVDLRVVPASAGWTPALEGPFVLIDFDNDTPIVHLENRRAALFFHESADVDAYRSAVDKVKQVAMTPADSTALIANVITELETTT
ncbi:MULTISPECIES: helix-turn-helix transcriptional regulator [unclassified Actinopolyspora]|uniref:helix-turn-helix domain-containing protein n=1 Tax=unclassified Actinopolyspora TaxID=2639451 RepID=UPI0013F67FA1|nr:MULTISPECIES: helix-turn-helix transcriptional regulator [unclassified Actinopolyspora]NHD19445.1 helix-turn-helix domain-containing protein [Actinopolyspora sp. BKK2]NHE77385.1 helix-turn-helix domain-containing protein [Actinopolyspora sp. BKK1]